MASTINAKNSIAGVVITPDTSGQLELQTLDTTRLTITSGGDVGIGTSSPPNISGFTTLTLNNPVQGGAIYLQQNGTNTGAFAVSTGGFTLGSVNSTPLSIITNSTERLRIDASGNAAFTNNIDAPNTFGFKNRVINGAMNIWQRGTSFINATAGTYTADRYVITASGINLTVTRDSLTPSLDFKYSLKVVPASNATPIEAAMRQWIEQQNIYDFAGQLVTASAWVYSNKTSIRFRLATFNATSATDSVQTINIPANTWTRISYTFPTFSAVTAWTSTPNSAGAFFDIGYVSSTALTTSDYIYITGVQLEKGSAATSFDYRPITLEQSYCYRYYYRLTPSANFAFLGNGQSESATAGRAGANFPVQMRIAPTALEQSGTAADYYFRSAGVSRNLSAVAAYNLSTTDTMWYVNTTVASGQVAGDSGALFANNTNGYLAWSAEV